ncbi:hypothetical protein INT43_006515 [Umbelopsis isabellina]|uniref:Uncharacterized protein n=1 Tax=Mortierella isabellina TaxID=91625 RepID=A0A8H7PZB9_MORIS|nr:hypothetical protein INT43_006515 [Umbelopsis isabellina]
MHKKRNYRQRVKEDSSSDEELSSAQPLDSTASKLTTLSFDDALESDIAFIPRAPMAKPSQNKSTHTTNFEVNESKQEDLPELEGADSRMTLKPTENRGYAVFAGATVTAGQTLLKEAPYGAVIDEENLTKYCSSCFKSSSQPLSRCSLCKQLYYCSKQCQANDWKQYHSIECPAFTKIGKPVPTAIRCLTRILISRANAPVSYNRVENLASHKDVVPEKVKMKYAQLIMALKQIVPAKIMPNANDAMDLICRFTVNTMSILGSDYASIGVGLYTNVCRLNHSCWPNCVLAFEGKTATLRTIRDIAPSEEMCISYIDVMDPYPMRQERLYSQYYFKCQCELCIHTQDVDIRNALRCSRANCTGPVRYPDELESSDNYNETCTVCMTPVSLKLSDIHERYTRVSQILDLAGSLIKKDGARALLNLENCIRIGDNLLHPCHHILVRARQQIKDIAIDLKDWDKAYSTTKQLFDLYQSIYPKNSPMTAIESLVIAKMYSHIYPDHTWKSREHYVQALKLLEIGYDPQSSMIRSVRDELRKLEAEQAFQLHQQTR